VLDTLSLKTQASRVDALIRLAGLFVFALGAATAYLTYSEAAQANIGPQVVPVFYLVAGLLILVGFLAMISRFK
jgi:hypothetical protein